MARQGMIIVVSAPSGAGKSTLCNLLVKQFPRLRYSISCTTRPRRPGERDGRDYFFVSEDTFKKMVRQNAFVEWARVHDYYYGTPRSFLDRMTRKGFDVILDIDVQGGKNIRTLYPAAVLIFIMTSSLRVLGTRLRRRKKDSEEVIRKRLLNARKELQSLPRYDYLVINDQLERATEDLAAIIRAEHRRLSHLPSPHFT